MKKKDNFVAENRHLQTEMGKLQEKLTLQLEQHQARLAELNSLHKQSEL